MSISPASSLRTSLDHLSYRAIARQFCIPEGTAKTHVARAKPLLRQVLASEPSRVHD